MPSGERFVPYFWKDYLASTFFSASLFLLSSVAFMQTLKFYPNRMQLNLNFHLGVQYQDFGILILQIKTMWYFPILFMLVTDVFVWNFFFFFKNKILLLLFCGRDSNSSWVVLWDGFVFAYMPCRIKYRFSCISNYNSRALQELCLFESVDEWFTQEKEKN